VRSSVTGFKVILASKEAVCKLTSAQETLEKQQLQEQETAKLSVSLINSNFSGANVAQIMLAAGNEKLQESSKQLYYIREENGNCQQKLARLECTQKNRVDVSHETMVEPTASKCK